MNASEASGILIAYEKKYQDCPLTKLENHELVALSDKLWWGSTGGRWTKVSDLDLLHLRNILISQDHISPLLKAVMVARLVQMAGFGKEMEDLFDKLEGEDSKG